MSDMDVSGTIGAVLNQKSGEIYSVSPEATVFEAVQLMDTKNVGALLVMDGDRLVGVISERDYTRKIMLRGCQACPKNEDVWLEAARGLNQAA